ncbi:hypothetical protein FGG08_001457 [Glutinoglossum americanum]|uniref:Uncharacterized protein n=1 Tax=Glutinoglossum americanum TaxID=1670608 RepID=A0A9P8IBB2_9PEZI|nr:hypothetical protein FGG08_001457 [Glutinoglossum americanum]
MGETTAPPPATKGQKDASSAAKGQENESLTAKGQENTPLVAKGQKGMPSVTAGQKDALSAAKGQNDMPLATGGPSSAAEVQKDRNHYAFNTAGVAYDYQMPERQQFLRISVRGISSSPLKLDSSTSVPPISPTPEELDYTQGAEQVLWVGMSLMTSVGQSSSGKGQANPGTTQPPPKRRRGPKPSKVSIDSEKPFDIIPYSSQALRVVVRYKGKNAKLYALVEPMDGLYRRKKWQEIIRDAVNAKSKTEVKSLKTYDTTRIDVPWGLSFANEVQSLVAMYTIQPESWILDALLELLKRVDHDLSYCPSTKNVYLHKLIDIEKKFGEGDAENVLPECLVLWPELEELDLVPGDVMELANGLRQGKVTLEYRLIRGVLVDWKRRCQERGAGFKDLAEAVLSTRKYVLLQIGEILPSSKSIKSDAVTAFVKCEADYLRSLTEYGKRFAEALKDSQGNQTVALDLPAIWANFKDKPDVDSARLYAINVHRYSVTQMMAKDQAIGQKLNGHVIFLDRFLESLKLAAGEEEVTTDSDE